MQPLFQCMDFLTRQIKYVLPCIIVFSSSVFSFQTELHATIFNAAARNVGFAQKERLIGLTKVLHASLNSEEQLSLYGHGSLKIASYMYLVDFWKRYSLAQVVGERGVKFTKDEIKNAGIDSALYVRKISNFGPLNYGTTNKCIVSKNNPYKSSYIDLIQAIERLQPLLRTKSNSEGAQAALVYLKMYFYQELHTPNATNTYTNNQCNSDLNGILTCADSFFDLNKMDKSELRDLHSRQMFQLKSLGFNKYKIEQFDKNCPVNLSTFIDSAGGVTPKNDGESVSASEVLLDKLKVATIQRANTLNINQIMKDNRDVMRLVYFNIPKPQKGKKDELFQAVMLTQMQIAALRTAKLLSKETLMVE